MDDRGRDRPRPDELARELVDAAYDAMFSFELPDEHIVAWNRGAAELYGWTLTEALGRRPGDLLHTKFETSREEVLQQLHRERRWSGSLVQTGRDGARIVVDARWVLTTSEDGVSRVVEVNRDVTEGALAAERFRKVADSIRDYAIFMLDARANVVTWSAGATSLTGWGQEVVGRPLPLLQEADGRQGISREAFDQSERAGRWRGEGWIRRKDGSVFWAETNVTAVRGPDGPASGYAVIVRDDTARRELVAARTNFVNFAAHEMRTPVTLLHGYLSMLANGDLDAAGFQTVLPTILARTAELQMLIEQMIESGRLEEGRLELKLAHLDLRLVVADVVEVIGRLASRRHALDLKLPDQPVLVIADHIRTRSIVRNLVDNAVKYSPTGGSVKVEVEANGGRAVVAVTDRGVGIAEADLPVVFARYGRVQTGQTRGISGAGLGLYMSRELARMQMGDIEVSSRPGEGSTFRLVLPLADRAGSPEPTFGPEEESLP